jgi:hypothetical protein
MTTTIHPATALDCPIWCTARENDIHRAGEDDLTIRPDGSVIFDHPGPEFGKFFQAMGEVDILTGETRVYVFLADSLGDRHVEDPEELRLIAAEATTAAKWLEAHR